MVPSATTFRPVVTARSNWIESAVSPPDGFRVFVVTAQLHAAEAPDDAAPLVDATLHRPYPDQVCQVDFARAAAFGVDLDPHYAVDADGQRFLPGSGVMATMGAGAGDPEPVLLEEIGRLLAPLRDWCGSLVEAARLGAEPETITWPEAPDVLQGAAPRAHPDNLIALRDRERRRQETRTALDADAQRERDADPIHMPPARWG